MLQVDVFWAYGIGAGYALAASHQLRSRQETATSHGSGADPVAGRVLADPYLGGAMLYCAAIFAPSGIWLLWAFPDWETMQVGGHGMPGWLVAGFALTSTTQGVVGFLVARWLIVRGMIRWAALQVMAGYFLMFFLLVHGWDGDGYKRLLSTDKADYHAWAQRSVRANVGQWMGSEVALTLCGIGAVMISLMLVVMYRYYRDGTSAAGVQRPGVVALAFIAFGSVFGGALGAAIAVSLLVRLCTMLTGVTAAGWVLGAGSALVPVWSLVVRRGGLTSHVIRWLALPIDTASAGRRPSR